MKSVIEMLFSGDIVLWERGLSQSNDSQKIRKELDVIEREFTDSLNDAQKKQYLLLERLLIQSFTCMEEEDFAYSFRLGALVMMDIYSDKRIALFE